LLIGNSPATKRSLAVAGSAASLDLMFWGPTPSLVRRLHFNPAGIDHSATPFLQSSGRQAVPLSRHLPLPVDSSVSSDDTQGIDLQSL
ncbi:MAG: hypothetical protein JAY74_02055, partial [Candidatus Thiodiazotropha taylori]|nr:hypothetical protein [Candidatus Thiodiazotropha taylori]